MKTVTIEVGDMPSALIALGVEKQLMRLPEDARRILRPSRSRRWVAVAALRVAASLKGVSSDPG